MAVSVDESPSLAAINESLCTTNDIDNTCSTSPRRMRVAQWRRLMHHDRAAHHVVSLSAFRSCIKGLTSDQNENIPAASRTLSTGKFPKNQSRDCPVSQQHWLDRRFPGLREWLDSKNRRWWLKGMQAWCRYGQGCANLTLFSQMARWLKQQPSSGYRTSLKDLCLRFCCRKYPVLQGSESDLQALIEQAYRRYYAKHERKVSDERSETHLQVRAKRVTLHNDCCQR